MDRTRLGHEYRRRSARFRNRGRRSAEVFAFFVGGFVVPLDRAIDDGLGDPFCILAGSVADGVRGGAQWGEGSPFC